ncbi:MAG: uncharacterized protein A8A55_1104 [Amphiamblys sp. WSBS2006]|nr:MAG: uncharacterized protein A8A55_1104 [Amphiamblys sp. WSBS2006]
MLLKNIQQIKNTIECMTKTIAFGGCIVNLLSKIKIGENNELNLFTLKAHTKNQIEFSFFEDKQSISIGKPKKIMLFGYAVDLLPKLKIGEENETEVLLLDATEREQVEYTLGFTHDKKEKICVGKVSHMEIYSWAANLVPRLKISEEMMMKRFILIVERKEHIKYILSEEIGSVVIGRPENIELHGHAVNAFTRLKISEDHVMERIVLSAHEETEVSELLSPWITGFGRAKALELADYAIGVLFCMEQSEDDVTEALDLRVNNETQTMKSFIENKTFYTEKILEITLHQYALNLLPILIQGNTVKRVLSMGADEEEQVRGLLGAQNTIDVGRVSEVKLVGYAIGVLPKLETSEENVMNLLSLCGLHEEHFFTILQAQDNKIAIGGRVVKCKVSSKKEVRQELEKILVDGKGNPIPIEEITNDLILD